MAIVLVVALVIAIAPCVTLALPASRRVLRTRVSRLQSHLARLLDPRRRMLARTWRRMTVLPEDDVEGRERALAPALPLCLDVVDVHAAALLCQHAVTLRRRGEATATVATLGRALRAAPIRSPIWFQLAADLAAEAATGGQNPEAGVRLVRALIAPLEAAQAAHPDDSTLRDVVLRFLINGGVAESRAGDPAAAIVLWEKGLTLAQAAGQQGRVRHLCNNIVSAATRSGRLEVAARYIDTVLAAPAPGTSERMIASCCGTAGDYFLARGDVALAEEQLRRALALRERADDRPLLAWTHAKLAQAALLRGDAGTAGAHLDQAARLPRPPWIEAEYARAVADLGCVSARVHGAA